MTAARDLANRLLDAQVDYVLAELKGERLTELVAQFVDEALAAGETIPLERVVDAQRMKVIGKRLLVQLGESPLVDDIAVALADGLYDMQASEAQTLGEVLEREPVEALVARFLSLRTLHERTLDRLTESPLVAVVASKFVAQIVADLVAQNRARAERVPGMSSLLSIGTSAANRVRSPFDQLLGDAADKGAQYALRRTNNAIRELLRDAPLQQAAMELWDLHAEEPIGDLREYLSRQELRDVILIVLEVLATARSTDFAGAVVDACVDVLLEHYGARDVTGLIAELGIQRDDLVEDAVALATPVLETAEAEGVLAALVRSRLGPFFFSPAVLDLLGEKK
ncbi:MAG TPA: hypothetical protein VFH38_00925 [Jatrophihabitans sp.]|nr:hypothetical protein [Jatrophihabitans sp.]